MRQLTGLAPAVADAGGLIGRLAGVPGAVAPVAVATRGPDLLVAYPVIEGQDPRSAAAVHGSPVCAAVARAVADLHDAGVVHGAIRASNVRVTAGGEVRLLDVGLAVIDSVDPISQDTDVRALAALLAEMAGAVQPPEEAQRLLVLLRRRERRAGTAQRLADEITRPRREHRARAAPPMGAAVPSVKVTVVVVSAAVAAAAVVVANRPGRHPVAAPPRARPVSPTAPCTPAELPASAGRSFMAVDMNGSGCAEPLAWDAGTAVAATSAGGVAVFRLGRPGDVLLVGRWSCRRADLPAVYRPTTGEVFYMSAWPVDRERVTSAPAVQTGVRGGTARTTGAGPCERVEVSR